MPLEFRTDAAVLLPVALLAVVNVGEKAVGRRERARYA